MTLANEPGIQRIACTMSRGGPGIRDELHSKVTRTTGQRPPDSACFFARSACSLRHSA